MQLFLSFLSGTLFFSLYNYFPFSCLALFISTALVLGLRKRGLPVLFIAPGIFYAISRYSPPTDTPYIWNKQLKVTGSFIQGGNTNGPAGNIETYEIDKAWDEEAGEYLDDLHDKEIGLRADFDVDYDDRYELLLETGKDNTRLNPGQPGMGRLYGNIISAEDTGRPSSRLLTIFEN